MAQRFDIDSSHSAIGFAVKHMMVATVKGTFGDFSGYVEGEPEDLGGARGEVTVDVASLTTQDSGRDDHLRSADFFDVARYPEMKFSVTGIDALGADRYRVRGDLTIRDVTRPIELEARREGEIQDPWGNLRIGVNLSGEINRRDFGLTWNKALEAGAVLVGDTVRISVEATLLQKLAVAA